MLPRLTLSTGPLDRGPGPQAFEKMSARAIGSSRQRVIPFRQEHTKLVAQDAHLLDALIQAHEALANEGADAPARRTASVSRSQNARQVREGEPDHQRTLNEQHALDCGRGISSVSSRRSRDSRKQSLPFVVPKGIGAHARRSGDIARSHRHSAHRVRAVVGSPVLCSAIWNVKN